MSKVIKSQWTNREELEKKVISIKVLANGKEELNSPVVVFNESEKNDIIAKAHEEAELILQEARVHAQAMHEKTKYEAEAWTQEKLTLIEQAKHEGFEQGILEGREKGYAEYAEKISFAAEIVENSKRDYQQRLDDSEKTIVDLALKAAEKIIGTIIKGDSEQFISIVKRALKEAKDYSEIQLHINPVHYGYLLSQKDEISALFPKDIDFYIFPDDTLAEDGCVIESANGRIDASVDIQLSEIKRKLIEILESEQT